MNLWMLRFIFLPIILFRMLLLILVVGMIVLITGIICLLVLCAHFESLNWPVEWPLEHVAEQNGP